MDNNGTPNPQIIQNTPKKKTSLLLWLLVGLLLLSVVAGLAFYASSQIQLKDAEQQLTSLQSKLNQNERSLKDAQEKLETATFIPANNQMSPQCNSGNNAQTKLAPVNTAPIDGYNVYIVNCVSDVLAGQNNSKVIAFKVDSDGNQTFVYGAGSGEPYCVSGKILPAETANNISAQTGLPVCRTF